MNQTSVEEETGRDANQLDADKKHWYISVLPDTYQALIRWDAVRWTAKRDTYLPVFVPMRDCGQVVDLCERFFPELGEKFIGV